MRKVARPLEDGQLQVLLSGEDGEASFLAAMDYRNTFSTIRQWARKSYRGMRRGLVQATGRRAVAIKFGLGQEQVRQFHQRTIELELMRWITADLFK